jgi:hypothetical protein
MAYVKTEEGQAAFKERSPLLSARQRSLFLLVDGVKSLDQILTLTKALNITQLDIDHLLAQGFIKNNAAPAPTPAAAGAASPPATAATTQAPAADVVGSAPSTLTPQERFAKAWPIATQLTAGMGIRGFRLNLAIEAASGFDDLLALLPKIQAAVGAEKCAALEQALKK